jgi:hypothetical protein
MVLMEAIIIGVLCNRHPALYGSPIKLALESRHQRMPGYDVAVNVTF